jgi:hypothetical protein
MELLKDVRDVSRIGYGFMASKALFAALDLDMFSILARGPATLETMAAAAGIPAKRLQTLLTALRALGLVGTDPEGSVGMPVMVRSRGAPGIDTTGAPATACGS